MEGGCKMIEEKIEEKKVIALIIMRRGSTGIKNKCMEKLGGKPLAKIMIDKCFESRYIDDVYVSTSDDEYKEIVREWGCEVIDRPIELSEWDIPNLNVYKHAVTVLDIEDDDYVVCIDICKPMTTVKMIDDVISVMHQGSFDSVFTVKPYSFQLADDKNAVVRQKLGKKPFMAAFGAVRAFTKKTIKDSKLGTWGKGEKHNDIPRIPKYHFDINDIEDFIAVEYLMMAGF